MIAVQSFAFPYVELHEAVVVQVVPAWVRCCSVLGDKSGFYGVATEGGQASS
jgi:hypothetical protein